MKILIVYDTYSGGTLDASTFIYNLLIEKGHTAAIKRANEVNLDEFTSPDLIIFGTPSWFVDNVEGKPHANFVKLMDAIKTSHFENKKVAVFGLGDETYAHFCRGVDSIETFIKEQGATIINESLKLNDYYPKQQDCHNKLQKWTESLLNKFQ